ncbi:MAG: Flp family type IVb pilin [Advenella sp.]|nr:Flp family type IVb pilin [Advenella sp.]
MKDQLVKFWKDEEGATAIEYALIAGLIAIAIIAGATVLGNRIGGMFNYVASKLNNGPA